METDNATNVRNLLRVPPEDAPRDVRNRWEGIGGRVDLVHKFDIYKLMIGCAFREKFQTQGAALFLPALISTEIVSNDLHKPIHYRLGLHQVTALTLT